MARWVVIELVLYCMVGFLFIDLVLYGTVGWYS